jgi:hypothetical protein
MTRRPEERLRMRFSEMMGSGDDQSVSGDGDTVVDALAPDVNAPDADPVESTDASSSLVEPVVESAVQNVVETVVAERAPAFEPVVPFEPAATFEPVATFEPEPSEPVAAGFADFTPLSDDLLPRKR